MTRRRHVHPPVEGSARLTGAPEWTPARFALSDGRRPELLLQLAEGDDGAGAYPLADITGLEEVLGAPLGTMHVEVAVDRATAFEAVWPEAFANDVVDALSATVAPASSSSGRTPVPVIAALAVAGAVAIVIGTIGLLRAEDATSGTSAPRPAPCVVTIDCGS